MDGWNLFHPEALSLKGLCTLTTFGSSTSAIVSSKPSTFSPLDHPMPLVMLLADHLGGCVLQVFSVLSSAAKAGNAGPKGENNMGLRSQPRPTPLPLILLVDGQSSSPVWGSRSIRGRRTNAAPLIFASSPSATPPERRAGTGLSSSPSLSTRGLVDRLGPWINQPRRAPNADGTCSDPTHASQQHHRTDQLDHPSILCPPSIFYQLRRLAQPAHHHGGSVTPSPVVLRGRNRLIRSRPHFRKRAATYPGH